jgi:hypothetical protein
MELIQRPRTVAAGLALIAAAVLAVSAVQAAVASLFAARICFVHEGDADDAQEWADFFAGFGAITTLIDGDDSDIEPAPLCDYFVIGPRTTWDDPEGAEAIIASGIPVLGLGEGGGHFFDAVGLTEIGHGLSALFPNVEELRVANPAYDAWSGPNPVDVEQSDTVAVYNVPTTFQMLVLEDSSDASITVDGLHPEDNSDAAIMEADEIYRRWGGDAGPENLTTEGGYVITNLLATMPRAFSLHTRFVPFISSEPLN